MNRTLIVRLGFSLTGEFISLVAFVRVFREGSSDTVAQGIIGDAIKRFRLTQLDSSVVCGLVDLTKDRIDLVDMRRRVFAAALVALAGALSLAADDSLHLAGLSAGAIWLGMSVFALRPTGPEAPSRRQARGQRRFLYYAFLTSVGIAASLKVLAVMHTMQKP